MIKIVKTKSEMRATSPYKILTVEIDLEAVQQDSQKYTINELSMLLGSKIISQLSGITKCKP
jgi:hypothetical protein